MPRTVTKTIATPRSKERPGNPPKTPFRNTLKSSNWYLSASQSIAIGRGGDYRGGHHWMRRVDERQD
jgi:hypothetical protein